MNPKRIIEAGYDQIAARYQVWASQVRVAEREKYTHTLLESLPVGARLLDLGCGSGLLTTFLLAKSFSVVGVDLSWQQLQLARRTVPQATFIHADMTRLGLQRKSIDAVAAFYSLIHVPRKQQPELLGNIARWLRPGGLLVATFGMMDEEAGYDRAWLGVPMFWSSYAGPENQHMVSQAGFQILSAENETADEFGAPVTFLWIVAQKCKVPHEAMSDDRSPNHGG